MLAITSVCVRVAMKRLPGSSIRIEIQARGKNLQNVVHDNKYVKLNASIKISRDHHMFICKHIFFLFMHPKLLRMCVYVCFVHSPYTCKTHQVIKALVDRLIKQTTTSIDPSHEIDRCCTPIKVVSCSMFKNSKRSCA